MSFNDIMGGLGHGMASLVGLGSLDDPMGNLRGELSSSVSAMNEMTAANSAGFATDASAAMKDLHQLTISSNNAIKQTIDYNNELIWDSMKEENIFIATIAATVIIIIFFMLIQKKCC